MLKESFPPWVAVESKPAIVCTKCGERREGQPLSHEQAEFALEHARCDERPYPHVERILLERVMIIARARLALHPSRGTSVDRLLAAEVEEINRALALLGCEP